MNPTRNVYVVFNDAKEPFVVGVFSTRQKAIKWLEMNEDYGNSPNDYHIETWEVDGADFSA